MEGVKCMVGSDSSDSEKRWKLAIQSQRSDTRIPGVIRWKVRQMQDLASWFYKAVRRIDPRSFKHTSFQSILATHKHSEEPSDSSL